MSTISLTKCPGSVFLFMAVESFGVCKIVWLKSKKEHTQKKKPLK